MPGTPALLTSSFRAGMQRLAVRGIFVADCHEQLRTILLRHLGPEHAALLAEPVCDPQSRRVDWYTSIEGEARPLSALTEEEARALREKASRYVADILALSRQETGATGALSGDLLALAVSHVDDSNMWSVGGEPVLVNWGYATGMDGVRPQDLMRLGGSAAPSTPTPAAAAALAGATASPVAASRTGCAGWLLPLLLLLLLLWLLLSALGWLPVWLPASCMPQPDNTALQAEADRALRLDAEQEDLLRQLREKAALCRPAPPPVSEPESPVQKPEADVVEPFFGESPVEPEPQPQPKVRPRPEPKAEARPEPRPKPRRGEDMKIPRGAAQKKDLSFLEGCWTSETGLTSSRTGGPVVVEYCFDKNGRGSRIEREQGGDVCRGPGRARFEGNRLYMESEYARCPDGRNYVPHWIECTGSGDTTQCKGREGDPRRTRWKARFRRK